MVSLLLLQYQIKFTSNLVDALANVAMSTMVDSPSLLVGTVRVLTSVMSLVRMLLYLPVVMLVSLR